MGTHKFRNKRPGWVARGSAVTAPAQARCPARRNHSARRLARAPSDQSPTIPTLPRLPIPHERSQQTRSTAQTVAREGHERGPHAPQQTRATARHATTNGPKRRSSRYVLSRIRTRRRDAEARTRERAHERDGRRVPRRRDTSRAVTTLIASAVPARPCSRPELIRRRARAASRSHGISSALLQSPRSSCRKRAYTKGHGTRGLPAG